MAITRIGNPAIADQRGINFRNILINGGMDLAQRGTSVSSHSSDSYTTLDRWKTRVGGLGVWTVSQSTDVPSGQGFANSLKWDCTTADASPAAGDFLLHEQRFEGQNLQYLKKGTSSATSLTLSFWVKSNKTGTYICELDDRDNTRLIAKSYTISSADTWEKKTLTFAGDTTGTLDNDNAHSFSLGFWLGAGSNYTSGTLATTWESRINANRAVGQVNLSDSTSNEWYITGVQLEAGQVASDFESLPYDVNLLRCQRYYWGLWDKSIATANGPDGGNTLYYTSTNIYFVGQHPVRMRAQPSLDQASGTNYYRVYRNGANDDFSSFTLQTGSNRTNQTRFEMNVTSNVSGTGGQAAFLRCNNSNAYIFFDAEL